jgi:hypothetical protein
MARAPRDYRAEFQRRNQLAQQRGFKSYGQQRRYVEYTGTPARYLVNVQPQEIAQIYQGIADYTTRVPGDDKLLDSWVRRSERRGISEEDAYNSYKKRARGGRLNRNQTRRLARDLYGLDWDEEWGTS